MQPGQGLRSRLILLVACQHPIRHPFIGTGSLSRMCSSAVVHLEHLTPSMQAGQGSTKAPPGTHSLLQGKGLVTAASVQAPYSQTTGHPRRG